MVLDALVEEEQTAMEIGLGITSITMKVVKIFLEVDRVINVPSV